MQGVTKQVLDAEALVKRCGLQSNQLVELYENGALSPIDPSPFKLSPEAVSKENKMPKRDRPSHLLSGKPWVRTVCA